MQWRRQADRRLSAPGRSVMNGGCRRQAYRSERVDVTELRLVAGTVGRQTALWSRGTNELIVPMSRIACCLGRVVERCRALFSATVAVLKTAERS